MRIESRPALISYQYYRMVCVSSRDRPFFSYQDYHMVCVSSRDRPFLRTGGYHTFVAHDRRRAGTPSASHCRWIRWRACCGVQTSGTSARGAGSPRPAHASCRSARCSNPRSLRGRARPSAPVTVLGSWGRSMRGAVRNKERRKRRWTPSQDPSTEQAACSCRRGAGVHARPDARRVRERARARDMAVPLGPPLPLPSPCAHMRAPSPCICPAYARAPCAHMPSPCAYARGPVQPH